mmetsp:Transcript_11937/g.13353  ORF Transcript_11937/g.13353 Transcript_11937/m.13353 type:complete len:82 (+) Transcript_11937:276-521(+)
MTRNYAHRVDYRMKVDPDTEHVHAHGELPPVPRRVLHTDPTRVHRTCVQDGAPGVRDRSLGHVVENHGAIPVVELCHPEEE